MFPPILLQLVHRMHVGEKSLGVQYFLGATQVFSPPDQGIIFTLHSDITCISYLHIVDHRT